MAKFGEGFWPSPVKSLSLRLELEANTKTGVERPLEGGVLLDRGDRSARGLQEVGIGNACLLLLQLVEAQLGSLIGHVEQVSRQADLRPLGQPDRIVGMEIDLSHVMRATT